VREVFRTYPLELVRTQYGREFSIGDSPAITIREPSTAGRQMALNVPIGEANTVVLPIAPDCLLAVSNKHDDELVTDGPVDFLNEARVIAARSYVYYGTRTESIWRSS
jgi:hypothetical protein